MAKKKYRKIKKNILIISLFKFNFRHKFYFLKKLEKTFNIFHLCLGEYLKYKSNNRIKKTLYKLVYKKKYDYYIDLLPIPDHIYNDKLYKKNLLKFYLVRQFLTLNKIRSIKFCAVNLNQWMVFPYKYFIFIRNFYRLLLNKFVHSLYKYPHTDYAVIFSDFAKNNEIFYNSKKLYLNHFDYIKNNEINSNSYFYAIKKKLKFNKNKSFILYLDQNYGSTNFDMKKMINKNYDFKLDKLNNELNNFFELIEEKFKSEVIISLHPRRNILQTKKIFKNRKVFQYKTAELVKISKAILLHDSMAVNYAIINKKPINIITSNQLENSIYKKSIDLHSKFFNKKKINISKINNPSDISKDVFFYKDIKKYNDYLKLCVINENNNKIDINKIIKKI